MRAQFSKEKIKKRKILNKKDLMREMYACKDCDCESYPWCTINGDLCKGCVDIVRYTHQKPLRSNPGLYATQQQKRQPQSKIDYPYISLIATPPDGDCLYTAISLAFNQKITISDLRHLVARCQTNSTFETYKELSTFMPEYRAITGTRSLRDFRILIKKTGEDFGIGNCVWGDENALQIISTSLRLGIMIFNQKGKFLQQILPEKTTTHTNNRPSRYTLLLLNSGKAGNEHYNLLEFNRHRLLTDFEFAKMKNMIT